MSLIISITEETINDGNEEYIHMSIGVFDNVNNIYLNNKNNLIYHIHEIEIDSNKIYSFQDYYGLEFSIIKLSNNSFFVTTKFPLEQMCPHKLILNTYDSLKDNSDIILLDESNRVQIQL